MNDTHSNTYEERQKSLNKAEARFEFFCEGKGIWYCRMGFDETNDPVPMFWKIHPLIRSLPDYLMVYKEKLCYVHVKGSNKLKVHDLGQYVIFHRLYCDKETPMLIAFCFEDGGKPIFKSIRWIEQAVLTLKPKIFPTDKKEYYELPM